MSKKILLVVAHSDDETIGMGGTIANHSIAGDEIFAISLTNGVDSRDNQNNTDIDNRNKAAEEASKLLGFKWIYVRLFPDNKMDTVAILEIVKVIEKIKEEINPDIIYTHCGADLNIDHQILNKAVLTAFRPQPNETYSEIRSFEVPSSTEYGHKSSTGYFYPNLFIDITKTWKIKEKALNCYSDEIREKPHARSIEGIKNLAALRGNQSGLELAESFEVLRRILR